MTTEATTEVPQEEEVEVQPSLRDSLPFNLDESDDVTRAMTNQIIEGIEEINSANDVLLEDEDKTSTKEIDKALKEYKGDDKKLVKLVADRKKAEEAAKKIVDETRNYYRVNVLGEEEVSEPDVDVEGVRNKRKVVLEAVTLLSSFSKINQNSTVLGWLEKLEIPQIGRQGTSVIGMKKPRVYVSLIDGENEKRFDSFGAAAKELTNDDHLVSANDMIVAWMQNGEKPEFEFEGKQFRISPKPKKGEETVSTPSGEVEMEEDESEVATDES